MSAPFRVAVVGAGRSRNGLGPFLAKFVEAAGGRVVAAVGRNQERADRAAAELGAALGRELVGAGSLDQLDPATVDALVIASPLDTHLPALRWAAVHGVHTLCEKPLVASVETDAIPELLEGFARAGATLMENCQWPQVLGAYGQLWSSGADSSRGSGPQGFGPQGFVPERIGTVDSVAMGLGPAGRGRAMVEDSLSHVISLAQAVGLGSRAGESLPQVRYTGRGERAEHVTIEWLWGPRAVPVTLQLDHCPAQPRPAWLAINGRRADRVISLPEYRMALRAGEHEQAMDDPMRALVYGFTDAARRPVPQRQAALRTEIYERARLYRHILDAW